MTAADALDLALLKNPQQRDLRLRGELADFLQEDRAAIRGLEAAEAALQRARKRALLVPEQLGRDERRRNGRAVHADECPARPTRTLVHGAGNQLFAGPRLAQDEHRRVVRATFATCARTLCSADDEPTISSNIEARSSSSRSAIVSLRIRSSMRLRSSISVQATYQRTICPWSSRSGL